MYDEKIKNGQSVMNHILKGESAKIVIIIIYYKDRPWSRWWFPNMIYNIYKYITNTNIYYCKQKYSASNSNQY